MRSYGTDQLERECQLVSWHSLLLRYVHHKRLTLVAISYAEHPLLQMYWALEKMYMGTSVAFDEQHYRGVWDRYSRALMKLPHLGRLRIDMLDRIK